MKEHESRKINVGEIFSYFNGSEIIRLKWTGEYKKMFEFLYIDSNNFVHNLNGISSPNFILFSYNIHGKQYNKKEFDIVRNRIEILEVLNLSF